MNILRLSQRVCAVRLYLVSGCVLALAGCGSGSSAPTGPSLASVSPGYAAQGSADLEVEAIGSGFTQATTLDWNGTVLVTSYLSATELKATVPSADLAKAGQYPVTAVDSGVSSKAVEFRVDGPLSMTALSPDTASVGSGKTTLTVTGTGFVPDSVVYWTGTALATTFVSVTELQAIIPAADLGSFGTGEITVTNPTENHANTLPALDFPVGYSLTVLETTEVNDMVWDPVAQLIYATSGANASHHPNSLLLIDPSLGTVKSSVAVGNNPNALSLADDSSLLYIGLDGDAEVERLALPSFTPDLTIPLGSNGFGPYYAVALAAAPGAPHTAAVSLGNLNIVPTTQGPVKIFDDGTARGTTLPQPPNYIFDLQWGDNANTLYSGDGNITSFEFYVLGVNGGGVSVTQNYSGVFDSNFNSIHYDPSNGLVYADNGQVVDPSSGSVVGDFFLPVHTGICMVPDSANGRAYFAYLNLDSTTHEYNLVLQAFDLVTHASIAQFTLPGTGIEGVPVKIILWGNHGLAVQQQHGGLIDIIQSSTFIP